MKQTQLSNEKILKIYEEAKAGKKSMNEIAKKYGVSSITVRRIRDKVYKKYREVIDGVSEQNDKKRKIDENLKVKSNTTIDKKKEDPKNDEKIIQVEEDKARAVEEKLKTITKDELLSTLYNILSEYLTPKIISFLHQTIVEEPKNEKLFNDIIEKLHNNSSLEVYSTILKMLVVLFVSNVLTDEYVQKILEIEFKNVKKSDDSSNGNEEKN